MSEGARSSKSNVWRYVSAAVSLLIVVGIFVYAIPKFADYAQVWKAITTLTPLEMGTLDRRHDLQPLHVLVGEHGGAARACASGRRRS